MKITIPIIHVKASAYFVGVETFSLELKGAFIYVDGKDRFSDFFNQN